MQHIVNGAASTAVDWSVLRLLNQYRLFLLVTLAAVYYLAGSQHTLGQRDSDLFEVSHLGYVVLSLLFVYLNGIRRPSAELQFYVQSYLDVLLITLMIYASGGVQSGLGPLLLINIALISQLTSARHAMLFAAIASTSLLSEELFARLLFGHWAADFERTAFLGIMLFLIAWIMTSPMRRLMLREIPEKSKSRAGLDVRQIAMLNEEIIRELDSGVLVVDSANHVQLINDTARTLLGAEFEPLPMPLKKICGSLLASLQSAKGNQTMGTRPFVVSRTGQSVLPRYIALPSGGMLIKLDDHAHIRQQFQQLKLASLGRLSASIAHEIRNPLGAISHAVQLMEESPTLDEDDARLLTIARRHTTRINRIVDDVLQLSNRQQVRTSPINLSEQIAEFCQRFREENGLDDMALSYTTDKDVFAIFDPEHLDQVLWNLCTNAHLHNEGKTISLEITCWRSESGSAIIDIVDDGDGIPDLQREKMFEPFYSTHHAGSGLGLFIIRELCELNKAQIDCLTRKEGAHFRLVLSTSLQMAA